AFSMGLFDSPPVTSMVNRETGACAAGAASLLFPAGSWPHTKFDEFKLAAHSHRAKINRLMYMDHPIMFARTPRQVKCGHSSRKIPSLWNFARGCLAIEQPLPHHRRSRHREPCAPEQIVERIYPARYRTPNDR